VVGRFAQFRNRRSINDVGPTKEAEEFGTP